MITVRAVIGACGLYLMVVCAIDLFASNPKPIAPDQRIAILQQEVAGYKAALKMTERRYAMATEKMSKEDQEALRKAEESDATIQATEKAVVAANAQIDQIYKQAQKQSHCENCSVTEDFQWLPPKK